MVHQQTKALGTMSSTRKATKLPAFHLHHPLDELVAADVPTVWGDQEPFPNAQGSS